jgi:hypothetical protein
MLGYVYLVGNRTFRWYKIGKSTRATIRVTELGILLPFRIEVIAVWKAENHDELERLLHERYAASRINGEWFSFRSETVSAILSDMVAAQTEIAASYSNLAEGDTRHLQQLKMVRQKPIVKMEKRIEKITADKFAALRRVKQLEKLLAERGIDTPAESVQ